MRKFVKTLIKIVTIIALIALLVSVAYLTMSGTALSSIAIGGLTWTSVLLIIGTVLLVAMVLSPKGFSEALNRMGNGFVSIADAAGNVAKKTFDIGLGFLKHAAKSAGKALFGKLGLVLGLGLAAYFIFKSDGSNRAETKSVGVKEGDRKGEFNFAERDDAMSG